MKHHITKFTLTLLASFTLAACSSGGSSGNNPQHNQTAPSAQPSTPSAQPSTPSAQPSTPSAQPSTPSAQPSTPSAQPSTPSAQPSMPSDQPSMPSAQPIPPEQPTPPVIAPPSTVQPIPYPEFNYPTDDTLSGVEYKFSQNSPQREPDEFHNNFSNDDFTHLAVGGKNIELLKADEKIGEFVVKNEYSILRLIGSSENTRWGLIWDTQNTDNAYLFALGKHATPKAQMPAEGKVSYQGDAAHFANTTDRAKVDLTVDFSNKTLLGTIKTTENKEIKLNAHIGGNGFEGSYNGTYTKGGFYGTGAENIIGSYYSEDPKDWYMGTYGATKQTQP